MSARIQKRASGPSVLTNAAVTRYTVGTNRRGIVTHLHVNNPSGSPVNFTWSIGADAAGTRVLDAFPIAAGASLDDFGPYTLEAAELIQAFASTTTVLVFVLDVEEVIFA